MIDQIFDKKLLKLTEDAKKVFSEKQKLAAKSIDRLPEGDQKNAFASILKDINNGKFRAEDFGTLVNKIKNVASL